MSDTPRGDPAHYPEGERPRKGSKVTKDKPPSEGGLPLWAILVSGGTVLGLLVFNVLVYGPDGYPTTVVLGGLFGTVFGVNEYMKNRGK